MIKTLTREELIKRFNLTEGFKFIDLQSSLRNLERRELENVLEALEEVGDSKAFMASAFEDDLVLQQDLENIHNTRVFYKLKGTTYIHNTRVFYTLKGTTYDDKYTLKVDVSNVEDYSILIAIRELFIRVCAGEDDLRNLIKELAQLNLFVEASKL